MFETSFYEKVGKVVTGAVLLCLSPVIVAVALLLWPLGVIPVFVLALKDRMPLWLCAYVALIWPLGVIGGVLTLSWGMSLGSEPSGRFAKALSAAVAVAYKPIHQAQKKPGGDA